MTRNTCPHCSRALHTMCGHRCGKYYVYYHETHTFVHQMWEENPCTRYYTIPILTLDNMTSVLDETRIEKLLLLA